ncbi:hypothetical protein [Mucilaginibacter sp.]|nr:hypothetical protein [Mucilaginibacter sp.]
MQSQRLKIGLFGVDLEACRYIASKITRLGQLLNMQMVLVC